MRYSIYIKDGEFCTATGYGPISDHDGFGGGYDTLEEALASLERLGADRGEIELPDDPHAANTLMAALEDWAMSLREAGVRTSDGRGYFPSRQMTTFRKAHARGQLFRRLTHWLPEYRGVRTKREAHYADRMRDIVEHGRPLWEQVVAARGKPWSAHITDAQRAILLQVRADVDREIAAGQRLRRQMGGA